MDVGSPSLFVAREAELATLRRCLERALRQEPQVALVEGEAGIGKSTLVRVFVREGQRTDAVCRASGDERESVVAYGVIAQLVEQMPGAATRETPGLRAGPMPGSDPLVIGAELAAAWSHLARSRCPIIVVEDLHWADVPSYDALVTAARRLRAARVLLVATYRPAELAHFGGRWERFANSDDRCTRIRLGGLRADAVRALARQVRQVDVPRAVGEQIVEHTGGNPLYTTALVEELPERALAEPSPSLPAPRSLAGVITTRLAALPPPARALVVAAGVLGRSCPLMTAARLADVADPLEPLEEAHSIRLLQEVPGSGGRDVMFPHPLIRAAVYEDLGPAARRDAHRRAAELTSGDTALHHRVAAAIGLDEELAADLASAASAHEVRGEMLAAADLWHQSAQLTGDADRLERSTVRSAICSIRGGDVAAALVHRDAVERSRATPLQQLTLAQLAFATGDAEGCERHLAGAWDAREKETRAAALDAATLLGELYVHTGQLDSAEKQLRSALRACPNHEPRYTSLLAKLAITLIAQGREKEAQEVTRDPAFAGSAATCAPPFLDGQFVRAVARVWTERLEEARDDLSAILRRVHEFVGLRYEYVDTLCLLGWAEYRLGRWDDAIARMAEGVLLAHDSEQSWVYPYVHGLAAIPWALRGKWQEAEAHVAAARAGASQTFVMGRMFALAGEATTAWARGDAHRVHDALTASSAAMLTRTFGPGIVAFEPLHVEALLDLGLLDEADARLRAVEDSASVHALPSLALDCARLRGKLGDLRGDAGEADRSFAVGTEHAPVVTVPLSVALFQLEHGRHLRVGGHIRAATVALREAHETFARLGAAPFVDAVTRELRSPGMPTSTSPIDQPSELTEKEVRVARLVAAGRTNREIGNELFLTVKAVEYHLARIYAKLGIESRSALAAWIARHNP